MQFLFCLFMGALIFGAITTAARDSENDRPRAVIETGIQVDQYRMFMFAAAQYMAGYAGGAATLGWDTLKTSALVPPGARNAAMPAGWRVVAAADNSWVACTAMDERAIGIMQQLAVQGGQSASPVRLGLSDYVVVGGANDVAKANLCN